MSISCPSTYDHVYILSYEEIIKYFQSYSNKICYKNEEREENGVASRWWLRTPGESSRSTLYVSDIGYIHIKSASVNQTELGVRPVIVVDIE